MGIGNTKLFAALLDGVETSFLLIVHAVGWPLVSLRMCFASNISTYARVFARVGILSDACHTLLDYRLNRWYSVAMGLEELIGNVEDFGTQALLDRKAKLKALHGLYSWLCLVHLRQGQLESAAGVAIRANKQHGFKTFAGINDFNANTAQILKAAIAASRFIGEGDVSKIVVEPRDDSPSNSSLSLFTKSSLSQSLADQNTGAKIIPFPNFKY